MSQNPFGSESKPVGGELHSPPTARNPHGRRLTPSRSTIMSVGVIPPPTVTNRLPYGVDPVGGSCIAADGQKSRVNRLSAVQISSRRDDLYRRKPTDPRFFAILHPARGGEKSQELRLTRSSTVQIVPACNDLNRRGPSESKFRKFSPRGWRKFALKLRLSRSFGSKSSLRAILTPRLRNILNVS